MGDLSCWYKMGLVERGVYFRVGGNGEESKTVVSKKSYILSRGVGMHERRNSIVKVL